MNNEIKNFLENNYETEIILLNKENNILNIDYQKLLTQNPKLTEELLDNTEETINKIKIEIKKINEEIKNEQIYLELYNITDKEETKRINTIGHLKDINAEEKNDILISLFKDRRDTTEKITKLILKQEKIYTTKEDEKSEMYIYQNGIYKPNAKTYIKEYCRRILKKAYTSNLVNEIIYKIESETYIEKEELFNKEYLDLIPLQDGLLNLKTLKIEEFTNKKIFFNKLPVKYDPTTDCPNIKKHLKTILENEEDINIIQELIGYCLLKNYKYEKAFMLTGTGRNGKSKTLELIKRFLGIDNCINISLEQIEKDQFIISEFYNKLVNLGSDINNTLLKQTSIFKSLTGRDLITAQRKFLTPIKFINHTKMIFCANEIPRTYDLTDAWFNRWIIINFPYTFLSKKEIEQYTKKYLIENNIKIADNEIINKMTSDKELSGLLNWSLEGLKRLEQQKDFSYSKTTNETKEAWIRNSDSFASFCMDCLTEDYNSSISKDDLRIKYNNYCRTHKVKIMSEVHIKIVLMKTFGCWEERDSYDGKRVSFWQGISLKSGQGGQGGQGYLPLVKKAKLSIGQKRVSIPSTLSTKKVFIDDKPKISDEIIFVLSKKTSEKGLKIGEICEKIVENNKKNPFFKEKTLKKTLFLTEISEKMVEMIEKGLVFQPKNGLYKILR